MAYTVSGTVGLPGMEPEGVLEPLGVATKLVETLFLGLFVLALVNRDLPERP